MPLRVRSAYSCRSCRNGKAFILHRWLEAIETAWKADIEAEAEAEVKVDLEAAALGTNVTEVTQAEVTVAAPADVGDRMIIAINATMIRKDTVVTTSGGFTTLTHSQSRTVCTRGSPCNRGRTSHRRPSSRTLRPSEAFSGV